MVTLLLTESLAVGDGNKNVAEGNIASAEGRIAVAEGKQFPLQKNKKANCLFSLNRTSPERTFCRAPYYRPAKPA